MTAQRTGYVRLMTSPDDLLARLNETRGEGVSDDGHIIVVLDGTSNLIDLRLDSKVMRLPAEDIAAGVQQAFGYARAAVQAEMKQANATAALPEPDSMLRLTQVSEESLKRLSDLAGIAQSIADKLGKA
jgi:DNA-binding protein YbaB